MWFQNWQLVQELVLGIPCGQMTCDVAVPCGFVRPEWKVRYCFTCFDGCGNFCIFAAVFVRAFLELLLRRVWVGVRCSRFRLGYSWGVLASANMSSTSNTPVVAVNLFLHIAVSFHAPRPSVICSRNNVDIFRASFGKC